MRKWSRMEQKILKAVLLLRRFGNKYQTKEEQLDETREWYPEERESDLDEWIRSLQEDLAKPEEVREAEAEEFRKALEEADGLAFYEDRKRYTSSTAGDYGPSNPWDAPGMSIRDFI